MDDAPRDRTEAEPQLNATPPSPLRLWGFLLTAVGALLAGVAAIMVWVTVGVHGYPILDSPSHGTDLADGRLVLTGAVVMLIAVLGSRFVHRRNSRIVMALLAITAGLLAAVVAVSFLATVATRFTPTTGLRLQVAAEFEHLTPEQIVAKYGGFRTVSIAPWLALVGGVLGVIGGILTLSWARRTTDRPKGAEAPAEQAAPEGSAPGEP